jgi:hypothetical protein
MPTNSAARPDPPTFVAPSFSKILSNSGNRASTGPNPYTFNLAKTATTIWFGTGHRVRAVAGELVGVVIRVARRRAVGDLGLDPAGRIVGIGKVRDVAVVGALARVQVREPAHDIVGVCPVGQPRLFFLQLLRTGL